MKRLWKLLIIATLATALLSTGVIAKTKTSFKDTQPTDWYMGTVSKLVELGGIQGYSDGTFKPNNNIKTGEFIKTVVASLGFDEDISDRGHWASNYRRRAVLMGLFNADEYTDLDEIISRYDMAKIATNTLDYNKEKFTDDLDKYTYQIKDYNNISNNYKDYVLKAYVKGIIAGYPDGTFGGDRKLTRAEASTVIIRILETDKRILPPTPEEPKEDKSITTELTEEDIERLQSYPLNGMYYIDKESAVSKYKGFEETYAKYPDDCELVFRRQLWTPINYPPKELKEKTSSLKWFSSPKLIYHPISGYGIRGIVQNTEGGKIYEADFEIMIRNTTEGTYLIDDEYGKDYSGRLSDWTEVK